MSVGKTMQESKFNAWKAIAFILALLVYLGGLLYSAVHNWSLLTAGVDGSMLIWAALGVITLEISAVAVPLALHFWFFDAMQRISGFAFYLVDAGLIVFNVVLDFNMQAYGGITAMPGWMQIYKFWGAPITPIICAGGWALMFLLDPSAKERVMLETLHASARAHLAQRVMEAAKAADITRAVDAAAEDIARSVIDSTLGGAVANSGRLLPPSHSYLMAGDGGDRHDNHNGNHRKDNQKALLWPKMKKTGDRPYNLTSSMDGELPPLSRDPD